MQKLTVKITNLTALLLTTIGTGVAQESNEVFAQKVMMRIRASLSIVFFNEVINQYKDMCIKLYPYLKSSILEGYEESAKRNTMIYGSSVGYVVISSAIFGKEYGDMIYKKVKEEFPEAAKKTVQKDLGDLPEAKRKEKCISMRNDFIAGVYDIEKADPESVRIMREEEQERERLRKR